MPRGSDDVTLDGAVAIVTGAAGGIGGAVVAELRAAGAKVVAEDIDPAVGQLAGDDVAALSFPLLSSLSPSCLSLPLPLGLSAPSPPALALPPRQLACDLGDRALG